MSSVIRFKAVPAVHLFLIKGSQVLLARRFNTGYEDGNFSVPAGHVDGDEPLTQAMIREAAEEVGVSVQKQDLKLVHVMHRAKQHQNDERIDFFFVTERWRGEPSIQEPDKCDAIEWFEVHDLPPNVIPYLRAAVKAYTQGQFFSEFGWK